MIKHMNVSEQKGRLNDNPGARETWVDLKQNQQQQKKEGHGVLPREVPGHPSVSRPKGSGSQIHEESD